MSKEIGLQLRRARESLGMTPLDVSRKTNIELQYIHFIEQGKLNQLPNLIYARAYVKAYAQLVGVNIQLNQPSRRRPVQQVQSSSPYVNRQESLNRSRKENRYISPDEKTVSEAVQSSTRRSQQWTREKTEDQAEDRTANNTLPSRSRKDRNSSSEQMMEKKVSVDTLPSRRSREREKKQENKFTTWYTWMLITGGVLLAIFFGIFIYIKMTSPAGIPIGTSSLFHLYI